MLTPSVLTVERQTEALEKAQHHWQQGRRGSGLAPALTIALSREAGTPGTPVARAIGARLGWPVYDHELVEKIALEMGLRAELVDSVDERHKSWLLEVMEGFSNAPHANQTAYVHHLGQTMFSLAALGRCIIVGRGAAQLLPEVSTLRVRLIGKLEDRIASTMRWRHQSEEQARTWIAETDRQRQRFAKDFFLKDPTDPRGYDLILNASRWSVPECADLTIQALKSLQVRGS